MSPTPNFETGHASEPCPVAACVRLQLRLRATAGPGLVAAQRSERKPAGSPVRVASLLKGSNVIADHGNGFGIDLRRDARSRGETGVKDLVGFHTS